MTYRLSSIILLLLVSTLLTAQRAQPDKIATDSGELIIQPILHGSLVLNWKDINVYVDPYGGAESFKGIAPPDLILITDIHGDHLHLNTLQSIETSAATFIVPQAVAEKLPEQFSDQVVVLNNNEMTEQAGIKIRALPMYNLPESWESRHPKGRGNGYLLTIGGKNVYISGDTEDIAEMRALREIDVAFVCMNLPYTMDINQAASAVLAFEPKIVYPFHYRGQGGLSDIDAFKAKVNAANNKIEVRLRNWYP